MASRTERLVFAVASVAGSTKACARRGDAAMFETLQAYYALADAAIRPASGRFVKPIGDAVLLTFPIEQAGDALGALHDLQSGGTALWQRFDPACRVQVKVGVGPLECGELGPPGDERYDVVGDALNRLFKAPSTDFYVSPEAAALLPETASGAAWSVSKPSD
jgi:class 3 adenylate cyclase